jgi:hypothetical protein
MNLDEVVPILLQLSQTDKLKAIQLLAQELTTDEAAKLDLHRHYEVWSPYDSAAAANRLSEIIEEHNRKQNG